MHEDDILRLRRWLGAGDLVEQGKGCASGESPDQCSAIHHSLLLFELRAISLIWKNPLMASCSRVARSRFQSYPSFRVGPGTDASFGPKSWRQAATKPRSSVKTIGASALRMVSTMATHSHPVGRIIELLEQSARCS